MKILTLIPARSGSKGINNKNIKLLSGKPLIRYTIREALKSVYLNKNDIICSTDSQKIADIAKSCGAKVPFLRPKEYSTDTSSSVSVAKHAIKYMENLRGYRFDYILLLQPTSPLRKSYHIDEAIKLMLDKDKDSVISITEPEHSTYKMKKIDGNDELKDFISCSITYKRRQDLPKIYAQNGAIYLTKRNVIIKNNNFFGEHSVGYFMKKEYSIDIDKPIDIKLAEYLLAYIDEV
jgi:CMP-N-acetylneuraminic acid synthetase